jgi:hypothetical protein
MQSNKGYLLVINTKYIPNLADNKKKKLCSVEDIFIICETSYWSASYFDKARLHTEKFPMCLNRKISSFSILPNEAFTFNFNDKCGVELEFRPRKKGKEQE